MSRTLPRPRSNRLLGRLTADDFALLQPSLKYMDLPLRKQLERPQHDIDYIYFLESGFASVVAGDTNRRSVEVGLIGLEGMTGLAVVMGVNRSPHEVFIQSAGEGYRIAASSVRRSMEQSEALRRTFLLYAHSFGLQTTYTAVSNASGKIEERLARWILMAHDRIRQDTMLLTHEFLSMMLGVRRAGVTVALNLLQNAGYIRTHRGEISIMDRRGLEALTKGIYGSPEAEYARLLGPIR